MEKEITVLFKLNNLHEEVLVSYHIDTVNDIQVITCKIKQVTFNTLHWLQLRNFELKSAQSGKGYIPLFSDNPGIKNRNASMFIDKAYTDIMAKEHFEILA
jgi:hypothetical protein